jgi:hypothetical protein
MRTLTVLAASVLLVACRGERVPHDYQNSPPAVTHPVTSSQQTPSAAGLPNAAPESTAAEGKTNGKAVSPEQTSTVLKDQAPSNRQPLPPQTDHQHATQTTSTAVTGTHLAIHP